VPGGGRRCANPVHRRADRRAVAIEIIFLDAKGARCGSCIDVSIVVGNTYRRGMKD
jgi:hypothetical protein